MAEQTASNLLRTRKLRSFRTIFALILREMSTTYGKSVLGYFWAFLEPVAGLVLMSLVFSLVLASPALGTNFPLFFASGHLIFQIYMGVGNKIATAVQFNRPLLEFPAVTPLDAIVARFILNFLTQILVVYVIIAGIIFIYDLRVHLDLVKILISLFMAGVFTIGIGTVNCYLFVAYPSYNTLWAIANRPMFILACVFYMFDNVPQPYRDMLWYNPLIHMVGLMRAGIYSSYDAGYVSVSYVIGCGLSLFTLGLYLINRNLRKVMDR